MANEEHVALLKQGVDEWNKWREENRQVRPDLKRADLRDANLDGANIRDVHLDGANICNALLRATDLRGAHLSGAELEWADLRGADLRGANLSVTDLRRACFQGADLGGADLNRANLYEARLEEANLQRAGLSMAHFEGTHLEGANLESAVLVSADLHRAQLEQANLGQADLKGAKLTNANLYGANLEGASLSYTVLGGTNLSNTRGLDQCRHDGPSLLDHRTILRSGKLPDVFLRGCGLPDSLIDYYPSLLNDPIQRYSCFISYSSKDDDFARRLHADLQDNGVRCWFAPEDLKIGERLGETIDEAIRLRDKLLLILSETSTASAWVTKEVRTALEEEEKHGKLVLFPVRMDDAVLSTTDQWAYDIKRTRHIGDFTGWKNHDEYQEALERLLRDLKVEAE